MDYLYGQLQDEIKSVEYEGLESPSIRVTVDNDKRTIKADIKKITFSNIEGEISSLQRALEKETSERIESYDQLNTILQTKADAKDVDTLASTLTQEISDREAFDVELKKSLDAEISRAKNTEQDLSTGVEGIRADLSTRATKDELNAAVNRLDGEDQKHSREIEDLNTSLEKEVKDRETAIDEVKSSLDNAVQRLDQKDVELESSVTDLSDKLDTTKNDLEGKIAEEARARQDADNTLTQLNIALSNQLSQESSARVAEDNKLSEAITTETNRALAAEQQNADNIANEITRAKAAEEDLDGKIASEITRAQDSESSLSSSISRLQNDISEIKVVNDEQNEEINNVKSTAENAEKVANAAIPSKDKGANGGVATLDDSGKIPISQLPSYVSDILTYANRSSFPEKGESNKIYVAEDTNLTYRWSGTAYVEISPSLALGQTENTAYPGNLGKQNADNITTLQQDVDAVEKKNESQDTAISNAQKTADDIKNSLDTYWSLITSLDNFIRENEDLDTYTTVGNYSCSANSAAVTLSNCPVQEAFNLKVFTSYGNNTDSITQLLLPYGNNLTNIYIRRILPSKTDWVAITGDISKYLLLSGGTLTGLLTAPDISINGAGTNLSKFVNDNVDLSQYWSLSDGTEIVVGADLNDLTKIGNYYSKGAVVTESLINSPTKTSFFMKVYSSYGAPGVNNQIIFEYAPPYRVYVRKISPISDWVEVGGDLGRYLTVSDKLYYGSTAMTDIGGGSYTLSFSELKPSSPTPVVGATVIFKTEENTYIGSIASVQGSTCEVHAVQSFTSLTPFFHLYNDGNLTKLSCSDYLQVPNLYIGENDLNTVIRSVASGDLKQIYICKNAKSLMGGNFYIEYTDTAPNLPSSGASGYVIVNGLDENVYIAEIGSNRGSSFRDYECSVILKLNSGSLANNSVTYDKLSTGVQESLDKADALDTKFKDSIPVAFVDDGTQNPPANLADNGLFFCIADISD